MSTLVCAKKNHPLKPAREGLRCRLEHNIVGRGGAKKVSGRICGDWCADDKRPLVSSEQWTCTEPSTSRTAPAHLSNRDATAGKRSAIIIITRIPHIIFNYLIEFN
jgi:hypothetical protein